MDALPGEALGLHRCRVWPSHTRSGRRRAHKPGPGHCLLDAVLHVEETFGAPLSGEERLITRVVIEVRRFFSRPSPHRCALISPTVGTPDTSAARRAATSLLMASVGRYQHLAAHVPAFLRGRELVLEVHAGRAGANHRFGQLEGVEVAAETGLRIRDDGPPASRRRPTSLAEELSSAWLIWSVRSSALLIPRSIILGTESTGYRL